MNNLTNQSPLKISHTLLFTIFYFDLDPTTMTDLSIGSEFTTVYSPWPNRQWRAVRFRVIERLERNFQEVENRFLEVDEVNYFDGLLKASVHKNKVYQMS